MSPRTKRVRARRESAALAVMSREEAHAAATQRPPCNRAAETSAAWSRRRCLKDQIDGRGGASGGATVKPVKRAEDGANAMSSDSATRRAIAGSADGAMTPLHPAMLTRQVAKLQPCLSEPLLLVSFIIRMQSAEDDVLAVTVASVERACAKPCPLTVSASSDNRIE